MDVPAEPSTQALENELRGGVALGVAHAALAGVLCDAGEARGQPDGALGGRAQRPVAHGRDHHRHAELERLGAVDAADLRVHAHLVDHVGIAPGRRQILTEGEVGDVGQGPRAAVAADAVAADLRLDVEVFLDLGVPVLGAAGKGEERNAAHLPLAGGIAQLFSGVDDLLEASFEGHLVAVEERHDVVHLGRVDVRQSGVGAEVLDAPADENLAAGHVLADALAGITEDDDAAAVHHVARHEVGVARAAQGSRFHDLACA